MGWLLLAGGVHLVFLLLQELSNLRMEEADAARTVYEMSVVNEGGPFSEVQSLKPGATRMETKLGPVWSLAPYPHAPPKHEQNQASVTLTNLK